MDEACSNIIKHAYERSCQDRRIQITTRVNIDNVEVLIQDFSDNDNDNKNFKSRELTDLKPGGLGTHFMNNVMDEVNYYTAMGGGHILRMSKQRPLSTKSP